MPVVVQKSLLVQIIWAATELSKSEYFPVSIPDFLFLNDNL